MKKFVYFGAVLLVCSIVYAMIACTPKNDKDGIHFFEGSWQEALTKAKAENKPIFVDIYATWCGPCKMLKRKTFPDKEVGTYFNANYISLELDGEKGDGAMLANKYSIQGYPSLMVFNKNGELVNSQMGYIEPDELLVFAKESAKK